MITAFWIAIIIIGIITLGGFTRDDDDDDDNIGGYDVLA